MNIKIISVDEETIPKKSGKGTYNQLTVTYKSDYDGKVAAKKLMDWASPSDVYERLKSSTKGDVFSVTQVKNDKGYLDWTEVSRQDEDIPIKSPEGRSPVAYTPTKSTYETPEERVVKQQLIVRQSCLANAIAFHTYKETLDLDEQAVVETAEVFKDYIYEGI